MAKRTDFSTESYDSGRSYGYLKRDYYSDNRYTTDDTRSHDSKYRSEQVYLFNDYSTSVFSYGEKIGKLRDRSYSETRSEELYSRKQSPNRRNKRSFIREDYFSPEEHKKRRKLLSNKYDREPYRGRRSRTTLRSEDFVEPSFDDEYNEKNTGRYKKKFEHNHSRERSPHKHNKKTTDDWVIGENDKRPLPRKTGKDYQVFAYNEVNQHGIFKGEQSELNKRESEVQVGTRKYPVLAFKDLSAVDEGPNMVYLPVIVLGKKPENPPKAIRPAGENITSPKQEGNFQIYAANLQDQTNIFQTFDKVSNEIPQQNSKPESTDHQKTQELPRSQKPVETSPDSRYERKGKSSLADKSNESPVIYQVNVDITSSGGYSFQRSTSEKEPIGKSEQIRYTEINDHLYDEYPVTKDYIKVNEITSEEQRRGIITERNFVVNQLFTSPGHLVNEEKSNTTGQQHFLNKLTKMSFKKSNVKKNSSEKRNESAARNSSTDSEKRRKVVESKPGSMAIGSHVQQGVELNVKSIPATTRLSTVREENHEPIKKSAVLRLPFAGNSKVKSKDVANLSKQSDKQESREAYSTQRTSEANKLIIRAPSNKHSPETQNLETPSHTSILKGTSKTNVHSTTNKEVVPEFDSKMTKSATSIKKTQSQTTAIDKSVKASRASQISLARSLVVGASQTKVKEPMITPAEQENKIKPIVKSELRPNMKEKTSTQEEKIIFVSNLESSSDQNPKHKKSLKNLASNFLGRRSNTSTLASKPKITQERESRAKEPTKKSVGKVRDDTSFIFVNNAEPISTLYKKEQSQTQRTRTGDGEAVQPGIKKSADRQKNSKSKTNLHEYSPDRSSTKKSKKGVWGILRRSKTILPESTLDEPQKEHGSKADLAKKEPPNTQEKPCDCVGQSIKQARELGYFFLGTSLYQQVIDILTVF